MGAGNKSSEDSTSSPREAAHSVDISRRRFLKTVAAVAGGLAAAGSTIQKEIIAMADGGLVTTGTPVYVF